MTEAFRNCFRKPRVCVDIFLHEIRWDWDRNCDTLDLAVGAPKMDGISDDNDDDYYNSGVVFLITVDASNGTGYMKSSLFIYSCFPFRNLNLVREKL